MRKRQWWALGAAGTFGIALGLGIFTFGYARGVSYLRDDPEACANCHIMNEHFAAWQRGSHRIAATCNDCHTPHDVVGKYTVKALNGFWHSFYFTTGRYPDPLRITEGNRRVTEETCRSCHAAIVAAIDPQVAAADLPVRDDADGVARHPRLARAGSRPAPQEGGAVAHASVVPAPLSNAAVAAIAAIQGGTGDGRPIGQGSDASTDPDLSCIRCHTYVGHWVR